jgi:hypothetical protein
LLDTAELSLMTHLASLSTMLTGELFPIG